MEATRVETLQGMLDMLIVEAFSLGPLHGYGVLLRIQPTSGGDASHSAGVTLSGALPARIQGIYQIQVE